MYEETWDLYLGRNLGSVQKPSEKSSMNRDGEGEDEEREERE